jgi:hypothetical protein
MCLFPIASVNSDYAPLDRFTSVAHGRTWQCWNSTCSRTISGIENVIAHRATEGNLPRACTGQLNLHRTELPAKKPCSIQLRTRRQHKFYTKGSQWKPTCTMSNTVLVFIAAFYYERRGIWAKFPNTKRKLINRGKRFYCYWKWIDLLLASCETFCCGYLLPSA